MNKTWLETMSSRPKFPEKVELVLQTLNQQGVAITQEHQAMVESCPDITTLYAWLDVYFDISLAQDALFEKWLAQSAQTPNAKLKIYHRDDVSRSTPERIVQLKQGTQIGRASSCDIQISSATVSRNHCRIELKEGAFELSDLRSTSGTYINNNRLSMSGHKLQHGDQIEVGDKVIVYEEDVA